MDTPFLIKTIDRPETLARLLRSLRKFYPEELVFIADDSEDHEPVNALCEAYACKVLHLPPDVGIGVGRNELFDAAASLGCEIAVLLDDDFIFTEQTRVAPLIAYVRAGLCDVAAGTVLQQGQMSHYEGSMRLKDGQLLLKAQRSPGGPIRVDIAYNFFAARVEKVNEVRWDEALKVCEHQAFFLRLQAAGGTVMYDPAVVVDHYPDKNPAYSKWRHSRANAFYALFKKLYGIRVVTGHL